MTDNYQRFSTTYVYLPQHPNTRVEWEWIGEGWDGDYNPDDPEDEPLLRFSVEVRHQHPTEGDVGDWEQAEDASYCTQNPTTTSAEDLQDIGESILLEFVNNSSPKKAMEAASWFKPREGKTS